VSEAICPACCGAGCRILRPGPGFYCRQILPGSCKAIRSSRALGLPKTPNSRTFRACCPSRILLHLRTKLSVDRSRADLIPSLTRARVGGLVTRVRRKNLHRALPFISNLSGLGAGLLSARVNSAWKSECGSSDAAPASSARHVIRQRLTISWVLAARYRCMMGLLHRNGPTAKCNCGANASPGPDDAVARDGGQGHCM
jgi:hypothetical protein